MHRGHLNLYEDDISGCLVQILPWFTQQHVLCMQKHVQCPQPYNLFDKEMCLTSYVHYLTPEDQGLNTAPDLLHKLFAVSSQEPKRRTTGSQTTGTLHRLLAEERPFLVNVKPKISVLNLLQ